MLKVSWSELTEVQVTFWLSPTVQTDDDVGEVSCRAAATEARARSAKEETILACWVAFFVVLFFFVFFFLVENVQARQIIIVQTSDDS